MGTHARVTRRASHFNTCAAHQKFIARLVPTGWAATHRVYWCGVYEFSIVVCVNPSGSAIAEQVATQKYILGSSDKSILSNEKHSLQSMTHTAMLLISGQIWNLTLCI